MLKALLVIVAGVTLTLQAQADFFQPQNFVLLTTVGGPTVSGHFTSLNLKNFVADDDKSLCYDEPNLSLRGFHYASSQEVTMVIGTETYKFYDKSPVMILFKTAEACKAGASGLSEAIEVGSLLFDSLDFPKLHASVEYDINNNLEVITTPRGGTVGKLIDSPSFN